MKRLFHATTENGLLARAQKSWTKEAESCDIEWGTPFDQAFAHADDIVKNRTDERYGIYILCTDKGDGKPRAPYYRLVHVNHKLPRTKHAEIRFTWSQVSPHVAASHDVATAGGHIADYLLAAMRLTQEELECAALRLYAPDRVDMEAAKMFTSMWNSARKSPEAKGTPVEKLSFKVVPSWLLAKMDA